MTEQALITREKELLLTNSKEWLVDQMIQERLAAHKELKRHVDFQKEATKLVEQLLIFIRG
jgi:hypothetical protein